MPGQGAVSETPDVSRSGAMCLSRNEWLEDAPRTGEHCTPDHSRTLSTLRLHESASGRLSTANSLREPFLHPCTAERRAILTPNATKHAKKTPSKPETERHQTHPKNAEQTRRGQPPTTPPRRLFPPARQRSQTPPDGRTNGRGVTGEMPAAAGVPYAPKPRATQTPPPQRTKRPPGHTNAKAGRTGQGNGRQRSRANPASRTPPNGRTSEGRGPARQKNGPKKRNAGPPESGRRRTNDTQAQGKQGKQAKGRFCPLLPDGRGLLREPFTLVLVFPSGADKRARPDGGESCSASAPMNNRVESDPARPSFSL